MKKFLSVLVTVFSVISCVSEDASVPAGNQGDADSFVQDESPQIPDSEVTEPDEIPVTESDVIEPDTDVPAEEAETPIPDEEVAPVPPKAVNQWGTSGAEAGKGVEVDAEGNIYVAGSTYGALDGNPCVMDGAQCSRDIFLTKFDKNGVKLWTKQWGSKGADAANSVAVDVNGNILVTGYANGEINGQAAMGNGDAFLIKVKPDGTAVWTKIWGSSSSDGGVKVVVDGQGNSFVAGSTRGSIDGNTITGSATCPTMDATQNCADAFVTKFTADGTKVWTKSWGTELTDEAMGIAVDAAGMLYVAGYTEGALETNALIGNKDVFLTKLAADGNRVWIKQWGTDVRDEGTSVGVDSTGNIFVAGKTQGDLDGNKCTKTMLGGCSLDAFLTRFNADGTKAWTKQLGSNGDESADSLALDAAGNVYIGGYTKGGLDGNMNAGVIDGFVTKWSGEGNKIWTKLSGTPANDSGKAVAVSGTGVVYLTGETYGVFPENVSAGNQDIFLSSFPAQ